MSQKAELRNIPIESLERNPENPRIFFRQEELERLLLSIKKNGLIVPISVYRDGNKYKIIDGERRWRTFLKLNYSTIPAIIHEKPSELENLLLMFNTHSLREQWDIYTIASKITRVIDLMKKDLEREPTEIELSEETGMTRGVLRRCRLIIALPQRFKDLLRIELEKSKKEQDFSEDLFLEMEGSLKTVKKNYPDAIDDIDRVRDVLLNKYLRKVINNVTDFRKITKISTAWKNVNYSKVESLKALKLIFEDNDISIDQVYRETVDSLYGDKKFINNASNFLYKIENLTHDDLSDETLKKTLKLIKTKIENLLR